MLYLKFKNVYNKNLKLRQKVDKQEERKTKKNGDVEGSCIIISIRAVKAHNFCR